MLAGCNQGPKGTKAETAEAKETSATAGEKIAVDLEASVVEWSGSKPTGTHHGTVKLSDGFFTVADGEVTGGQFVIDLTSIVDEDITDPEMNARLVGHLKSEDFFHVDSFPSAEFVITSIAMKEGLTAMEGEFQPTHEITGNLTMKGITRSVTFTGKINRDGETITGESNSFTIDRTEWNVNYGSRKIFDNLKDQFIHDEMGLRIKVVGR